MKISILCLLFLGSLSIKAQSSKKKPQLGIGGGFSLVQLINHPSLTKDYLGAGFNIETFKQIRKISYQARFGVIHSARTQFTNEEDYQQLRNIFIAQLDGLIYFMPYTKAELGYVKIGAGLSGRYKTQTFPVEYYFDNNKLISQKDIYSQNVDIGLLFGGKSEIKVAKKNFIDFGVHFGIYHDGTKSIQVVWGLIHKW